MRTIACVVCAFPLAVAAWAQQTENKPVIVENEVRVTVEGVPGAGGVVGAIPSAGTVQGSLVGGVQGGLVGGVPSHNTFQFVSAEMAFGGKVVKGKPYSADAVTETRQILADGNRINRKMNSELYRDGEGRTRREQSLAMVGPLGPAGTPPKTILIDDPVAGMHYVLNPQEKTARKLQVPQSPVAVSPGAISHAVSGAPEASPAHSTNVVMHVRTEGRKLSATEGMAAEGMRLHVAPFEAGNAQYRNESLGTQTIEGVQAEGTRTVTTIPAGEIGNERPIEAVFERWYSPELETVVMTRQVDPRMGETTYRLLNIRLGEPARQLFEIPADYKSIESGVIQTIRHVR